VVDCADPRKLENIEAVKPLLGEKGAGESPCRLPSRQFLAKQKLAILTASKKGHLGQRPKNDGTNKR